MFPPPLGHGEVGDCALTLYRITDEPTPQRSSGPPPLPPAVRLTVSSRTLALDTVHPQSGALAVMVNSPVPAPPPVNVNSVGDTSNVHPEPPVPAWPTVIVCPAIVAVPVRRVASGFGATTRTTLTFPVPVGPVESESMSTVIQSPSRNGAAALAQRHAPTRPRSRAS